ncbi:hypothetical protein [Vibrio alfacsensis]|uniref:Porin n=1 Tax=Vibrio alfacsensis TaxID=1074311 RepID=A0ABN5PJY4_9VIBR|nr:hypothetical protein [Vibrio alfacsensis]AXY03470.1 hypothetical protein D1115_21720 [Vibrio alfacsensis]BBM67314.1 hypothetical protein VA249_39600 [Vibrio alfacsensis]BCN26684.1 hypothetical protein VYA_38760 [Vibrio alfacsensis]
MNKLRLLPLTLACLSTSVFASNAQVYIEQNIASNAADQGTYTTEAGATISTSENGQVYIGFDDQGWLAAGYGHDFPLSESLTLNLYGELGKWETGEEMLLEATIDYQVTDNFNLFAGYGYNRSGQTLEQLSDTAINTNQLILGTGLTMGNWALDYQYTHENRDGSNGGFTHVGGDFYFSQDAYRTNEHELVLSTQIDNWTPYVKYTYFNTNEGELSTSSAMSNIVENDSIWTIGLSYDF